MTNINSVQQLFLIGIQMRGIANTLQIYYPSLCKEHVIKRLLSLSNKWDNVFTEAYKITMEEVRHDIS